MPSKNLDRTWVNKVKMAKTNNSFVRLNKDDKGGVLRKSVITGAFVSKRSLNAHAPSRKSITLPDFKCLKNEP